MNQTKINKIQYRYRKSERFSVVDIQVFCSHTHTSIYLLASIIPWAVHDTHFNFQCISAVYFLMYACCLMAFTVIIIDYILLFESVGDIFVGYNMPSYVWSKSNRIIEIRLFGDKWTILFDKDRHYCLEHIHWILQKLTWLIWDESNEKYKRWTRMHWCLDK